MLTLANLTEIVADATKVEADTVRQVARFVRQAGYLPTSRGKALAKVGTREAACLLSALLADGAITKAGDAVALAESLRANVYEDHRKDDDRKDLEADFLPACPSELYWGLPADHSFIDMLDTIFRALLQSGRIDECPIIIHGAKASIERPINFGSISLKLSEPGSGNCLEYYMTFRYRVPDAYPDRHPSDEEYHDPEQLDAALRKLVDTMMGRNERQKLIISNSLMTTRKINYGTTELIGQRLAAANVDGNISGMPRRFSEKVRIPEREPLTPEALAERERLIEQFRILARHWPRPPSGRNLTTGGSKNSGP